MITCSMYFYIIIILFSYLLTAQPRYNYSEKRSIMVETQIRQRGVSDSTVLQAMLSVPRHHFVPEELLDYAYDDSPLPIGFNQTISQPYIVAYMSELLNIDSSHTVLEIGTGSGYQAAILSLLAGTVFTIEIVPELGTMASRRLEKMEYNNVSVRVGDGYKGWPEAAPFDRIIVTAAPEEVPEELVRQLKPGGIMVLPYGAQWWSQDLVVISKDSTGRIKEKSTIPVRFVPMVHGRD